MKPTPRAIILFAITFAALVFLGFKTRSGSETQFETLIVKSVEAQYFKQCYVRVYRGNEKKEEILLEKEKDQIDQVVTILNRLNKEGYEVASATEYVSGAGICNSYVLVRRR